MCHGIKSQYRERWENEKMKIMRKSFIEEYKNALRQLIRNLPAVGFDTIHNCDSWHWIRPKFLSAWDAGFHSNPPKIPQNYGWNWIELENVCDTKDYVYLFEGGLTGRSDTMGAFGPTKWMEKAAIVKSVNFTKENEKRLLSAFSHATAFPNIP